MAISSLSILLKIVKSLRSFLLCVLSLVDFIFLSVSFQNWSVFWVSKTGAMFFSCCPNLYTFSFLQLLTNVLFIQYSHIFWTIWSVSPCFTPHLERTTLLTSSYMEHLAFGLLDLLFSDFDMYNFFPSPLCIDFAAFIQTVFLLVSLGVQVWWIAAILILSVDGFSASKFFWFKYIWGCRETDSTEHRCPLQH